MRKLTTEESKFAAQKVLDFLSRIVTGQRFTHAESIPNVSVSVRSSGSNKMIIEVTAWDDAAAREGK